MRLIKVGNIFLLDFECAKFALIYQQGLKQTTIHGNK